MKRGWAAIGMVVAIVAVAGCSRVQKGSAVGGALGSASGAAVGHFLTRTGGSAGALVGLGLGAAGGAIAAEYSYGEDETGESLVTDQAEKGRLANKLKARDAQLKELAGALEREKTQQRALLEAYEKSRGRLAAFQADLPEGVQVTTEQGAIKLTILSEVLFASGKAQLSRAGKVTLRRAAQTIRREFPDAQIEVRGHTDNAPIRHSAYKSNWELSCHRALAVVHYLIESHRFKPQQLVAAGCADARPVATNKTAEGRKKNRRAELVIRPKRLQLAEITPAR